MRSTVVHAAPGDVARRFNEVIGGLVVTPDGEIQDGTPPRPEAGAAVPDNAVPAPDPEPVHRPAERWD